MYMKLEQTHQFNCLSIQCSLKLYYHMEEWITLNHEAFHSKIATSPFGLCSEECSAIVGHKHSVKGISTTPSFKSPT
jgi:hypothetical protein